MEFRPVPVASMRRGTLPLVVALLIIGVAAVVLTMGFTPSGGSGPGRALAVGAADPSASPDASTPDGDRVSRESRGRAVRDGRPVRDQPACPQHQHHAHAQYPHQAQRQPVDDAVDLRRMHGQAALGRRDGRYRDRRPVLDLNV